MCGFIGNDRYDKWISVMSDSYKTERLKDVLEKIPQVNSVDSIQIDKNIIEYVSIDIKALGIMTIRRLDLNYSMALFDFYFKGLSEASRKRFYPYPLFDTPLTSAAELTTRIKDWQKA